MTNNPGSSIANDHCIGLPDREEGRENSARVSKTHRRIDPRVSLFILLLLNVTALVSTSLVVELSLLFVNIGVMCWCKRPWAALKWTCAYGILFGVGWFCLVYNESILATVGAMFLMFKRAFSVIMFGSNMIATTRVGEMACALQKLGLPRRLIVALCVALRFFPTMKNEFKAVLDAMKIRGIAVTPLSVITHPVIVMENILVPIIARLGIVADELANAATVRGIDSNVARTSYYSLRISWFDVVVCVCLIAVFAYALMVRVGLFA